MRRMVFLAVFLTLLAGCAATEIQPSAQAGGTLFRGEVWTWDEATNVVTLRTGAEKIRVQVTPDQIRSLRLHEFATVRGELAPPAEIEHIVTAGQPMRAVPQGTAQQMAASGIVSAAHPNGLVSIDSSAGALTVWTAGPDVSGFPAGTPVRLNVSVQPVTMVAIADASAGAALAAEPSLPAEPGDHAVVTGRVLSVDSKGTITVESPRGPIVVPVSNAASFRPGMSVQVRTSLSRAQ